MGLEAALSFAWHASMAGWAGEPRLAASFYLLVLLQPCSPSQAPYPRCMVDSVALLRLRSAIDVRLDIEMEYGEDHQDATTLQHDDLRRIPSLYPGERQLPTGDGEEPPSQPCIEGMEPDLPAT